jgi:hypothetical protein
LYGICKSNLEVQINQRFPSSALSYFLTTTATGAKNFVNVQRLFSNATVVYGMGLYEGNRNANIYNNIYIYIFNAFANVLQLQMSKAQVLLPV